MTNLSVRWKSLYLLYIYNHITIFTIITTMSLSSQYKDIHYPHHIAIALSPRARRTIQPHHHSYQRTIISPLSPTPYSSIQPHHYTYQFTILPSPLASSPYLLCSHITSTTSTPISSLYNHVTHITIPTIITIHASPYPPYSHASHFLITGQQGSRSP